MTCPAIDHGVAIFPDGKIRPCCRASAEYSKPISEIANPNRFADLRNQEHPSACEACYKDENQQLPSYRQMFVSKFNKSKPGIQFLDLRHSNQCNLKCRYCNPHFSNQWARELGNPITLTQAPVEQYYTEILTDNLNDLYFAGGEPLIIKEHYEILEKLIAQGLSKNVSLRYSTNFTTTQYKDKNLLELWKNFKSVNLLISLDAAGPELNYIRSGSDWNGIDANINALLDQNIPNLTVIFLSTLSILNIWFLPALYAYAQSKQIPVTLNILHGPDYLSLCAVYTDHLKDQAKSIIDQIKRYITQTEYNVIIGLLNTTDNEYLFNHAVRHILLLDSTRDEKLFELLPFKQLALDLTAKNNEYE